jgi:hypothetical protein
VPTEWRGVVAGNDTDVGREGRMEELGGGRDGDKLTCGPHN